MKLITPERVLASVRAALNSDVGAGKGLVQLTAVVGS